MSVPFSLVTKAEQLAEAIDVCSHTSAIAVDTEGNSRFHYPERVSLVQVATPERVYIIDPIDPFAVRDMSPLGPVLVSPSLQKVFHGADYDLRGLNRDWGFTCRNVYDTNIAARFAGLSRLSLSALIEDLLGITIPKSTRLQRSDWSRRPLTEEALQYAATDVIYLIALRDRLDERLRALGRTGWVAEELSRLAEVRYVPPDPEWAFLSIKGSYRLDQRGLTILNALHKFRDTVARRAGRPPAYLLTDEAMIFLASNPEADLTRVPSLSGGTLHRLGDGIRRTVREAMHAAPIARPASPNHRPPPTREQSELLRRLKSWRTEEGHRLAMDPSLLWPASSLERLARAPSSLGVELGSPEVRGWQKRQFADALRRLLAQ